MGKRLIYSYPFWYDRELAHAAAKKGGAAIPAEKRAFARDPELASRAARLGAMASVKARAAKRAKKEG